MKAISHQHISWLALRALGLELLGVWKLVVRVLMLAVVIVTSFVVKYWWRFGKTQVVGLWLRKIFWRTFKRMRVVATLKNIITVWFSRVVGYLVVVWLKKIVAMLWFTKFKLWSINFVTCNIFGFINPNLRWASYVPESASSASTGVAKPGGGGGWYSVGVFQQDHGAAGASSTISVALGEYAGESIGGRLLE